MPFVMVDEDKSSLTLQGRIKWFDPGKGFGFIVADEAGGDILLHANVLRNFGQSSIADGAEHYGQGAADRARGAGDGGAVRCRRRPGRC